MRKANRLAALLLALALLCGMFSAADAGVATLGICFSGVRTSGDGSETTVRLEGRFRVLQNGEEIGTIEAWKEALTLSGTERVRIVPLAETITPEWDLSTAWCEVQPPAGGTTTVSVVVYPLKPETEAEEPPAAEPAPEPEDVPEEDQPEDEPGGEEEPEAGTEEEETGEEEPEPAPVPAEPVQTPTLPPYDPTLLAPTPEPAWITLPQGTSSISVLAYHDQATNGLAGDVEPGVADVTVCLLTESDEAVASVKTGNDGKAEFRNLPEGKYRIKAILPQGWAFGRKGGEPEAYASIFGSSIEGEAVSDPFTLKEGVTAFPGIALDKCLHVSGTCWFETTADGLLKDGEPPLSGVKITLDGVKNGQHFETWSDENGYWRIDRVSAAFYDLTAYAPDGMMFARVSSKGGKRSVITKDGASKGTRRLDLNDKESKDNLYIGFTWAGQIYGRCFLDANYNGLYDEGEPPMPGVKVTAIKQAKDEEVAVTYSGEDGTYTLTGLRGNTYRMRAVLPADGSDFTRTVSDPLGNHFKARPGRRENFWPDFTLEEAGRREMNVGVIYPGSITGYVYMDNDFSASLTGKEKTVSGFLVTLLDEKGNVVASDKTSVKGKYELTKLAPGNYSLSVTAVKGYAFTKIGEGNVILNRNNGEGYSDLFYLALGENRTGMDIGMIQPGTVTGSVFADLNDNGVRDEGENGLPGVTVKLMSDEGEAFSAEIGEDGKYLFDAVMPGRYWVEYDLPENAVFARTAEGGNTVTGEDGTGKSAEFDFATGATVQGPVCGALTLGRIEGSAYHDHNGDGQPSADEEPMEGMTLTLVPSREELEEISVITGEDGSFALEDLRPDTYTLTVTCPDRNVMSRTDHISLPLTAGKDTQSVQIQVPMGKEWTGEKLGSVIPASLSGQLWMDENNNGLFDEGESTPAGYAVTVTDDMNGRVFDTLFTDEEGRFATSGMIPGTFTVSYPLDADTIAPKKGDSVFEEIGGRLVVPSVPLAEGESREGLLLGVVRYTSIGGTVWIDRGDAVEPLAGAVIVLKDGADEKVQTLTTGESGAYRFEKLMPGTYTLEASMPEGCVIIEPGDRRLDGSQISVITQATNRNGTSDPIDLKMAEDQLQMNIGCVLPGRLGDFCWLDLDGDGLQGMDEPGIPGVRIVLRRDGETIAETESDQYGFYRFYDLYPAVYTLEVTPPSEVKPTVKRTDIRMIASVLEESDAESCVSAEIQVESDKANYNADLGFVDRQKGVNPPGINEGKKQNWTKIAGSDR